MKKLIIFASVLALTFSMSMNAFATEDTSSVEPSANQAIVSGETSDVQKNLEEKKAAFEQKKAEAGAFRDAVKEKRDAIKASREENKALRLENKELRSSLAASIKELKDSGTVLDAEVAAKLEECDAELKASASALKDTKGDIKEITAENKGNIKARDYEAMEAAFDEIYEIQESRNASLVQINELLEEMIALL